MPTLGCVLFCTCLISLPVAIFAGFTPLRFASAWLLGASPALAFALWWCVTVADRLRTSGPEPSSDPGPLTVGAVWILGAEWAAGILVFSLIGAAFGRALRPPPEHLQDRDLR